MTTKDKPAEALKMPDEDNDKEFDWESNRDDENPKQLPWPDENESKVGTTRPRISVFMQRFRNLGLLESSSDHFMIIKEKKLTAYLASIA